MSVSALARLWLRRSSKQLRAASSTSSSSAPPTLPVGPLATSTLPSSTPAAPPPPAAHEPSPSSGSSYGIKALRKAAVPAVKVARAPPSKDGPPPLRSWKGSCARRRLPPLLTSSFVADPVNPTRTSQRSRKGGKTAPRPAGAAANAA
jgi:hypothetical protein